MQISIILLTWNSQKYVVNCLNSIMKSINTTEYEIIVVDNGSQDRTLEILTTQFPDIQLIKNRENRGVAPARNQGIRASKGEYIMILDIDTYVKHDAIDRLIEYMNSNHKVGICGPQLCFEDGAIQNSFRRFPLIQTKLLRRIDTDWARKLLKDEYYYMENGTITDIPSSSDNSYEVDYIIGACQLIRRSALNQIGLLDEKIFYGPEDVDLCLRMWEKGWLVVYFPHAQVIHYEQRITKGKMFSYVSFKHIQGLLYYFFKHRYLLSRKKIYSRIGKTEGVVIKSI